MSGDSNPQIGQLLTGVEIYDAIMGDIEPDLVSNQIPLLKEIYKDESSQEKEARLARYQKAFAEYDQRFDGYVRTIHEQVHHMKKSARKEAEEKSRAEEATLQENIMSQIFSPQ